MLEDVKRIVVKVGTSTLIHKNGKANLRSMSGLVSVLSGILNSGVEVVLVTSGAIGAGSGKLGLKERPRDTPGKQAAAAVGQCELMFLYDKLFSEYGHTVGQLLITKSDVENDERRENLINTFKRLFDFGVMPIVNENDSVAVEEIVYGDNDNLSAIVACLIEADLLILLSDIDGLYDANPAVCEDAKLIPIVEEIDDSIIKIAGGAGSDFGTGGMATKINAAKIAGAAGIDTIIINGSNPQELYRVLEGEATGTIFKAVKR